MKAAAQLAVVPQPRVLVRAADPARRDALLKLVRERGYAPVETMELADVVLCETDCPACPGKPVLALGGVDADQSGWLPGDASANQIDAALAAVAAGLTVRIAGEAQAGFAPMQEHDLHSLFTPREMEVLNAIADGLTNKMIARRLAISLHTVKFHVESLFRKLGVRTRTEAVARALERRIRNTLVL
jgi:DNA-binding CsgD family transcriptional regulator